MLPIASCPLLLLLVLPWRKLKPAGPRFIACDPWFPLWSLQNLLFLLKFWNFTRIWLDVGFGVFLFLCLFVCVFYVGLRKKLIVLCIQWPFQIANLNLFILVNFLWLFCWLSSTIFSSLSFCNSVYLFVLDVASPRLPPFNNFYVLAPFISWGGLFYSFPFLFHGCYVLSYLSEDISTIFEVFLTE